MSTFRLNDPVVGNPAIETVKPQEPKEIQNTEDSKAEQESTNGVKEIILKGPLGHAYTEALKLLLNKETNASGEMRQENIQQAVQAQILLDEDVTDNVPDEGKGFIYVYDGKKMGLTDISHMFDDLTAVKQARPKAGLIAGSIENADVLLSDPHKARNLETLITHLESIGVPMYFSKRATLSMAVAFAYKAR